MRMEEDIRKVLASNVLALLVNRGGALKPNEKKGYSRLVAKGIPMGTAQRVLDGDTSIGIDKVQEIAEKFGAKAWQLLVPDFNAGSLPKIGGAALPFSKEVSDLLARMDPDGLRKAENALRGHLEIEILARPANDLQRHG